MTQTRPEPAAEAGRHPRYPAGPGYDPTQGHAKGQTWPEHGWPIQPEPAYDSTAHQAAPLDERQWAGQWTVPDLSQLPGTGTASTTTGAGDQQAWNYDGRRGWGEGDATRLPQGWTGGQMPARPQPTGSGQRYWPGAMPDSGPTTWAPEASWTGRDGEDDEDYSGPPPRHLLKARPKQRASWREDLITGVLSSILGLGLVIEGWSGLNLQSGGAILSPWHVLLALGFLLTGMWIATRHQVRRAWSLEAVPPGYGLGLVGIGIALVALVGDAAWHALTDPAAGMVRITAPFRLMLFLGAGLLVTSGYRAAWAGPSPARGLSLRAFSPILLPMIVATTLVSFSFQFASPYVAWRRTGFDQVTFGTPEWTTVAIAALFTVLVTNLVFVAPMLLTLRRWQPPFGAITITFGAVAVLNSLLTEMALGGVVAAALAGGLAADLVVSRWSPGPDHPGHLRLVAVVTPLAYWLGYFAVLAAGYGQTWHPSLWLGALAMVMLSGYVLAVLMQPSPVPATAWAEPGQSEEGAGRRR